MVTTNLLFPLLILKIVGRDSVVGIATCYGLDGAGIELRSGRNFPHPSRPALGPTQSPIKWIPGHFPEIKRPGRATGYAPYLAPRLKKEYNYFSTFLLGFRDLF
jgi:hypothetical protein